MLHAVTSPQEKQQKVFTFIKPEKIVYIVHSPNPTPSHPQTTHDGGGGEYWYEKHVTFHIHRVC